MKYVKKNGMTTFKYNDIDDSKIYDVLENKVIDKSQFVKNALYYYITMIERGSVIDRAFPYECNTNLDNISQLLNLINTKQFSVPLENETSVTLNEDMDDEIEDNDIEEENNEIIEEYDIPADLLNVTPDDYDY